MVCSPEWRIGNASYTCKTLLTSAHGYKRLTVFGKGEKVNLTKAERNELRRVLSRLVAEYQKGVKRHVQGR